MTVASEFNEFLNSNLKIGQIQVTNIGYILAMLKKSLCTGCVKVESPLV